MGYKPYNPNPLNLNTGDCVVRAVCMALGCDWKSAYIDLTACGFKMADVLTSNRVWAQFLKDRGFQRISLPDACPGCYTVADFCKDFPEGIYVLGTGTHAVTVVDGDYYDAWDSGSQVPIYYFRRKD